MMLPSQGKMQHPLIKTLVELSSCSRIAPAYLLLGTITAHVRSKLWFAPMYASTKRCCGRPSRKRVESIDDSLTPKICQRMRRGDEDCREIVCYGTCLWRCNRKPLFFYFGCLSSPVWPRSGVRRHFHSYISVETRHSDEYSSMICLLGILIPVTLSDIAYILTL